MTRIGLVAAAAFMMLLPKVASATTYTFHDTESSALSSSPVSFDFSLDTTTATAVADGGASFSDITIEENGTPISGNTVAATFTTNLSSSLFFLIDTGSEPFYSGAGTGITFHPGTFVIADGFTDGEGTLTVSDASLSPVPEPATWTLLLAGIAAGAVFLRFSQRPVRTIKSA